MLMYMVYKIIFSDCLSSPDRDLRVFDELEESCEEK
jgi:hypothetical protein